MNKTILSLVISGIGFGSVALVAGLISQNRLLRNINRKTTVICEHIGGSSFRETYEDNEPQNPDEFERYFSDCGDE